ncbi:hypothetical protein FJZ21_00500 [Candidatus Pacearchaeota archaeon]|nr:hypothetical protein [Candidatus Pacearchaeota archaeon]
MVYTPDSGNDRVHLSSRQRISKYLATFNDTIFKRPLSITGIKETDRAGAKVRIRLGYAGAVA